VAGILFDLDGVFYVGDEGVPGGAEALDWARRRGIPHCFLTNTTSRPRSALVDKLAGLGVDVNAESILTPAVAAARWIRDHVAAASVLFVPEATRTEFAALPLASADADAEVGAVVIGDLGEQWDFATLNAAFRLLMRDPPPTLVALGMTRYWRAPDGLRLDVAPFVVALAHASGVEPVVLGKPAAPFFEVALSLIGVPADEAVMVGDDIRGDIGGALEAGIPGILVRTGKFRESDLESGVEPVAVLDSIGDLPRWWASDRD